MTKNNKSIEKLKKEIEKLKLEKQKELEKAETKKEKEKLIEEIKNLKYMGSKAEKTHKVLSKTFKAVDVGVRKGFTALEKFTGGVESANTGLNVGDKVKILRGMYKGKWLIITGFVSGGIQGVLPSGVRINIRHGGYENWRRMR